MSCLLLFGATAAVMACLLCHVSTFYRTEVLSRPFYVFIMKLGLICDAILLVRGVVQALFAEC